MPKKHLQALYFQAKQGNNFKRNFKWTNSLNSKKIASGNVLVVGAGISGLAAAQTLSAKGFSVKILESRDRAGGRILTDRSLGVAVDMGAAWLHAKRGNPLWGLVKKLKIPTMPTDYSRSLLLDDAGRSPDAWRKLLFSARANRIVIRLQRLAGRLEHDISIAEAVRIISDDSQMSNEELCFLNRHLIELQALNASQLEEQSLFAIADGSCCFASATDDLAFPFGYDLLVNEIRKNLDIVFSERALRISTGSRAVTVETENKTYQADAAVITLPLGVLKSGTVEFDPALPERMRKSISEIRMGVFNKVALRFPERFWPDDSDLIEFIPRKLDITCQILNWHRYTKKPVLVLCLAADTAKIWETYSDEQIGSESMKLLYKYFGDRICEPDAVAVSRWGLDKNSFGAYSVVHPGAVSEDFEALGSTHGRLFFAGEASSRQQLGTVHGANLSGIRAANKIINRAQLS